MPDLRSGPGVGMPLPRRAPLLALLLLTLVGAGVVRAADGDEDGATAVPAESLNLDGVFSSMSTSSPPPPQQPAVTLNASDVCQTFGGPTCAVAEKIPGLFQPCSCKNDTSASRCECVLFYQCDMKTGKYDQDGTGIIDLRKKDGCPDVTLRCCAIPEEEEKGRPPRLSHKEYPTPAPPSAAPCGSRNDGGLQSKIINAVDGEAGFAEFPWMVAVLAEGRFRCGGVLLTESVVLTAAHCVKTVAPAALGARMGEWDRESEAELYKHQDRAVRRVLVHPKYYGGNYRYDAALLLLDAPAQLGYNVGTACLPEEQQTFDGQRCIVTGWGKEKMEETSPHRFLKKLDLSVVPRGRCESMLRATHLGPNFKLHESFICAGGEKNKDTCKGDGGGPLVCPFAEDRQRYRLAGIVAWGVDCGQPGVPGLYANAALLRPWIDAQLDEHSLDKSPYQP